MTGQAHTPPMIREAKRSIRVLKREGADPNVVETAEAVLDMLRNHHRVETEKTAQERARAQRGQRLMAARARLLVIAAEAETDNNRELLATANEAIARIRAGTTAD